MQSEVLDLVYSAIDEINALADDEKKIEKSPDAILLGDDSVVDSLAFVNLVVAIENQIRDRTQKSVVLISEDTLADSEDPFRTVGTLTAYIEKLLSA